MVGTGFFRPRVSESPVGQEDMAKLDNSCGLPKADLHAKQATKHASDARHKGSVSSGTGTTNDKGRRLPKLTANCGNRPFTTQGFSSPWSAIPGSLSFKPQPGGLAAMPPAIYPPLPNEQVPAMMQYVSVPGLAEPYKMRRCSWEEAGLSTGGACSSNSSSSGITVASVGLGPMAPQVSGGVPAFGNPAFAAVGACAAPGAVSTQFEGASCSQFGPQVLLQPMMQRVPYHGQAAVVPQYGGSFAPPAAGVLPTAPQSVYGNHSAVLQQQQHLANPGSAAAPGAVLQLQPQLSAGNGAGLTALGPACTPSTLQGASVPGQLYPAGGNASGAVLGASVLGAPATTAPPLGSSVPCVSAAQARLLPAVHGMVAVPPQNLTVVAGGLQVPVQDSAPAAAPCGGAMQGAAVLPEAPGLYAGSSNVRLAPAAIAPTGPNGYTAPTGYAAPVGGGAPGVDVSSVAAAVAQDKLAQMQQLEAMQQQLRRDVYTLLPYIEPPHPGVQQ